MAQPSGGCYNAHKPKYNLLACCIADMIVSLPALPLPIDGDDIDGRIGV